MGEKSFDYLVVREDKDSRRPPYSAADGHLRTLEEAEPGVPTWQVG